MVQAMVEGMFGQTLSRVSTMVPLPPKPFFVSRAPNKGTARLWSSVCFDRTVSDEVDDIFHAHISSSSSRSRWPEDGAKKIRAFTVFKDGHRLRSNAKKTTHLPTSS